MDIAQIDLAKTPRHVAIIMDGNGRWAKQRSLPRFEGHRQGIEAIQRTLTAAAKLPDIEYLTLYAFSTENWKRPQTEIRKIMNLVRLLPGKIKVLNQLQASLRTMGRLDELSLLVRNGLNMAIKATQHNKGLKLNFAVNYGGREEILDGLSNVLNNVDAYKDPLTIEQFSEALYTPELPDVDLLIRTSGDCRVSNFMLWHIPYAEIVFSETLWPDFDEHHFYDALYEYQNRSRRFGNL